MHGESQQVEELPGCTIEEVSDSWGRIVEPWSDFVRRGCDVHRERVHGPALLTACGDVRGLRVLDLGTGEGWCARELAGRGAKVTGIDVSPAMIAKASTHPEQAVQPIDYLAMDAKDVAAHRWPARFDLVTACMSLHCMPDPEAALWAVRGVLGPRGRLVASIPHWLTHMLGGRNGASNGSGELTIKTGAYFESKPYRVWWTIGDGEPWSTIRWSRPRSHYTGMLKRAGFVIADELEPFATVDDIAEHERLRKAGELPHYQVIVAKPDR